jgi:hypothetical protein
MQSDTGREVSIRDFDPTAIILEGSGDMAIALAEPRHTDAVEQLVSRGASQR